MYSWSLSGIADFLDYTSFELYKYRPQTSRFALDKSYLCHRYPISTFSSWKASKSQMTSILQLLWDFHYLDAIQTPSSRQEFIADQNILRFCLTKSNRYKVTLILNKPPKNAPNTSPFLTFLLIFLRFILFDKLFWYKVSSLSYSSFQSIIIFNKIYGNSEN